MTSIRYSDDPKLRKAQKIFLWTVVGLAGFIVFGLIFGYLIQFLWNVTLAEMFGFPELSFWQAIGLFVLAKLFFGFGGGSSSNRKRKKKRNNRQQPEEFVGVSGLEDDESFKKFWQEEGKSAYETFRQNNQENQTE